MLVCACPIATLKTNNPATKTLRIANDKVANLLKKIDVLMFIVFNNLFGKNTGDKNK